MEVEVETIRLRKQFRLMRVAMRLEKWLSENAGDTKDWPLHLHVDNTEDAETLAELLTELTKASLDLRKGAWDRLMKFLEDDDDDKAKGGG